MILVQGLPHGVCVQNILKLGIYTAIHSWKNSNHSDFISALNSEMFGALSLSELYKVGKGGGSILIRVRLFGIYPIEAWGASEFLLNRDLRKEVDLLKDDISVQEGCVLRTFHYIMGLIWINMTQACFFLENCCLHHFFLCYCCFRHSTHKMVFFVTS